MSLTSLRSVIRLSLFIYSANKLVIQKIKEEEQWDNVPDEFEVSHSSLFVYIFSQQARHTEDEGGGAVGQCP